MTKVIAVLAGKGGTGKTTSSIGLGAALTYFGKDVVVVDTNLTTPNVGIHLGAPVVPINLHHVLRGKNKVKDAIYVHPKGLKIIPASIALKDLMVADPARLAEVIGELKKTNPDFILLDGAAGLGREALSALECAEEVLVVTNPELPAITDALKTVGLAEQLQKNVLGVVLTKVGASDNDINLKNIESLLERPIISVIPYNNVVRESLIMKDSVVFTHPKSEPAIGYKKLAAALIGQEYSEDSEKGDGLISRMFKRFFN
ncbi:MAG: cell division ATPase MinD [Nanoarchaeota archaeon]|nr:cell division ATPase MinD [Nanoarchaeota archaeon]